MYEPVLRVDWFPCCNASLMDGSFQISCITLFSKHSGHNVLIFGCIVKNFHPKKNFHKFVVFGTRAHMWKEGTATDLAIYKHVTCESDIDCPIKIGRVIAKWSRTIVCIPIKRLDYQ